MYYKKRIKAFSLIEISIALVIIGLLTSSILKGKNLLESAKINSFISQMNQYKLAINNFTELYNALPGDFSNASSQIKPILVDGNENGIVDGDEDKNFWIHLYESKFISKPSYNKEHPKSKIGGTIKVKYSPNGFEGHWFIVSNNDNKGVITPKQAISLLQKSGENDPVSGSIKIGNGNGQQCLKADNKYNIENEKKSCVIYVQLD